MTELSRAEIVKAWANLVYATQKHMQITEFIDVLNEMFADQFIHRDRRDIKRVGVGFKFNRSTSNYFKIDMVPMPDHKDSGGKKLVIQFVVKEFKYDGKAVCTYQILDFIDVHCNPEFKIMSERFVLENL